MGTVLDGDLVFTIQLWRRVVRKVSLLFSAFVVLSAGSFSSALASKCYGLDPCNACRNCHACKHCHLLGGKCGVCKGERNARRNTTEKVASKESGRETSVSKVIK